MVRALGDYSRLMVFPANLHMERTVFDTANFGDRDSWRKSVLRETERSWYFRRGRTRMGLSPLRPGPIHSNLRRRLVFGGLSAHFEFIHSQCHGGRALALPRQVLAFSFSLPGLLWKRRLKIERAIAAMSVIAIIALGTRAWMRSTDWHDDLTFFQRTVSAGGVSARTVIDLALANSRRGNVEPAERALRRAVQIWPDYPLARNNLADLFLRQNKVAEAEALSKAPPDLRQTEAKTIRGLGSHI